MMAGWMNRKQQMVIEYLLEENRVLREQRDNLAKGKRIRFSNAQRRRLAEKGRRLGRQVLMQFATIVTPECIYAWHRKFVAMKFAPKGDSKTDRRTAAEKRREKRNALIIKLASENRGWGYGRIQGVMKKLGWHKLSTSTIGEVLRKAGIRPNPDGGSKLDWKTFVRVHADQLAATDFFFVPVMTLRGIVMYRVHFVIDIATRKVQIVHIGCQYHAELMKQLARNLTDCFDGFLLGKKWLIHDRDPLFTDDFGDILRSAGVKPWKLPPSMPMMNAYAESFVKSIKRECLDKIIFFSEEALRNAIREYMEHYHQERPHQGLDNKVIEPDAEVFRNQGRIVKTARLGGLLNDYHRAPAPDDAPEDMAA